MQISMKEYEKWCLEYAERWNKADRWEFFCLVKDAWINGFFFGRKKASIAVHPELRSMMSRSEASQQLRQLGEESVEVEMDSVQIGMADKYSTLTPEEKFKNFLETIYHCQDIRVTKDKNGLISFQGTFQCDK